MPVTDVITDTENLTMTVVADFAAPIERVWSAYSDPRQLEQPVVISFTDNPIVFLLLINVLLILLGMVIDATAVIMITVPVIMPIATQFGIDPIHLGVIIIVNLMIGLLTPPVGSVLYVMSSVTSRSVDEVFRGIAVFLVPLIIVQLIITFFPPVVTGLPALLGL